MFRTSSATAINPLTAKENKAQTVASYLPFTLFFPVGVMYGGALVFLIALLLDGGYRVRWQNVKTSPIFPPALLMSVVFIIVALYSDWRQPDFWVHFAHYQTYLFLLLFISAGAGAWQERAVRVFIAGAVFAATVYYLTAFGLVPARSPFTSYVIYAGNKSILLGLLLAIAAGFIFYDFCSRQDRASKARSIAAFVYVCGALLFVSKSRTSYLIFLILIVLVLLRSIHLSRRSWAAVILSMAVLAGLAWQTSPSVRQRATETVNEVQDYAKNMDTRVQTSTGNRLQMYRYTMKMIAEKPLYGFGIGGWLAVFHERYKNTLADLALTPHNDYLLYTAEGGLIGLGALLFVWLSQLRIAGRMGGREGMWLSMLTVTMMVSGLFNAILRDAVFGVAMMVLLSIPLAGASLPARNQEQST